MVGAGSVSVFQPLQKYRYQEKAYNYAQEFKKRPVKIFRGIKNYAYCT